MRDGGEKLIGALLVSVIKLKDVPLKTLVVTESSPFIYWATQYTAYAAWVMAGFPLVAPTAFWLLDRSINRSALRAARQQDALMKEAEATMSLVRDNMGAGASMLHVDGGMDDAFDNAQESARPGTADTGDSGLSAQPIADNRKAVSAPIRKGPAYQQPR
jgi:hypothetical protein